MIPQLLFILSLYLLGFLCLLSLKRTLPFPILCFSAFPAGSLVYTLVAIGLLSCGLPFTLSSIVVAGGLIALAATWFAFFHQKIRLDRNEILALGATIIAYGLVVLGASRFNFTIATMDSFSQIMLGRTIAFEGLTAENSYGLSQWGALTLLLQASSVFLGVDYLNTLHPTFGLTLLLLESSLIIYALRYAGITKPLAWFCGIAAAGAMLSTNFILLQMTYIHTNFPGAVFLLLAVGALWLSMQTCEDRWLFLSLAGFLGFTLMRTEAPLFSLIFLVLAIQTRRIGFRPLCALVFPFILVISLWYIRLGSTFGEGSDVLDQNKTLLILGLLLALGGLVFASRERHMATYLIPHLGKLMLGGLLVVLLLMWRQYPAWMTDFLVNMLTNLFQAGRWGATWYILLALLLLGVWKKPLPQEQLFAVGIACFFLMLLATGYMRSAAGYAAIPGPFSEKSLAVDAMAGYDRLGWADSTNRIVTHIFPLFLFYGVIKNFSKN